MAPVMNAQRTRMTLAVAVALLVAACGQTPPTVAPTGPSLAVATPVPVASTPDHVASATPTATPSKGSLAPLHVAAVRSDITLPEARTRAVAVAVGSTLMVCGGLTGAGVTSGTIWSIDPGTGHVAKGGTMAAPVHDGGAALLGSQGIIVGGGKVFAGSVSQRLDPSGSTIVIGKLPAVRADLAVVSVAGGLLVVGGGTPAGPDTRVLATTDGHAFRTVAHLRVGVRYAATVVLGDVVYVIGGSTPSGDTSVIQSIDPRTGTVRIVGNLPHALSEASAFVLGGELLIAGGRRAGRAQAGIWRFDPSDGHISSAGRLPYAVADAAVVVQQGTAYLIGGESTQALSTIIAVTAS